MHFQAIDSADALDALDFAAHIWWSYKQRNRLFSQWRIQFFKRYQCSIHYFSVTLHAVDRADYNQHAVFNGDAHTAAAYHGPCISPTHTLYLQILHAVAVSPRSKSLASRRLHHSVSNAVFKSQSVSS